jgi:hypothetical protein
VVRQLEWLSYSPANLAFFVSGFKALLLGLVSFCIPSLLKEPKQDFACLQVHMILKASCRA